MSLWAYKYLPYRRDIPESFPLINCKEELLKDCNIPKHMLVSMSLFKLNPQFKAEYGVASIDDNILQKVFLKGQVQEKLYCFCLFVMQFYQRRINTPNFVKDRLCYCTNNNFTHSPPPPPPPPDLLTLGMCLFPTPGWILHLWYIISLRVWHYIQK